ncbi:MAG: Gfo/Idh/MocA family protein [Blastocatellia bacterium]
MIALTATTPAVVHRITARSASDQQHHPAQLPGAIRVGIIGLDGHYSEITGAARILPNIRITAIAETKTALLQSAKRSAALNSARIYEDYRRMLDQEKPDVVAVCGENGVRAAIVQACAERRIPVVAEKPLAISLKELEAVKRAVVSHNAPLTMLLPMRFSPQYQAVRNIVRSGAIGEVVSIDAQKSYKLGNRPDWMKVRKTYGGTIPYIGIHMVDLMRWASGREFVEVAAFQSNVGFPEIGEMENNAAVIFRMDNRGAATLRLDYLRPATAPTHGDDRLRIAGTKGVIEYREGEDLMLMTNEQKPVRVTDLPAGRFLFVDFLESLYLGQTHLIRPEEIFRVTEIVLKAREAAESNGAVRL